MKFKVKQKRVFFFLVLCLMLVTAAAAELKIHTTAENPDYASYDVVPTGDVLPKVTARSAVVIEAKTGKVLYERNADQLRYPASTTKMMTLIVALENSKPDEIVTASKKASETDGSTIWLEPGEKQTMEDLEYAMMLVSGNDATVAVAEHIAGSVDKYAQMMTKKAHEIGANDTNFINSSGLPDPKHYSTAMDLAKIAAYGYNNVPNFEKIVSTKETQIPWNKEPYNRVLRNENLILHIYDGCNGVKTGYTDDAGRCVVTAAKRNGVQLISVVLDGIRMWDDSIAMLNYGFEQVEPNKVIRRGEKLENVHVPYGDKESIPVHAEDEVVVGAKRGEKHSFKKEIELNENLQAPVKRGAHIGKVHVVCEGKRIAHTDIIAADDVNEAGIWGKIIDFFKSLVDFSK